MSVHELIYSVGVGFVFFLVMLVLFLVLDRVHKRMGSPVVLLIGIAIACLLLFSTCGTIIRDSVLKNVPAGVDGQ